MLNSPNKDAEQETIKVHCYFVRHRNALAVRAQFSELYTDFYLHLMQHGLRYDAAPDQLLKDGLAALTLHLASRPRGEATAWTLNIQDPLLNLFVTGSSRVGNVTGRAFVEGVKQGDANLFFSQVTEEGREARQSTVEFDEADVFRAVETYYRCSEQRPARYFHHGDEDYVMLTAQPDCDMPWFLTLDDESIRTLDDDEELSLLEVREYRFDCGCNVERMYPIIASLPAESALEIFDMDGKATAQCPRCGAGFALTREGLREFLEISKRLIDCSSPRFSLAESSRLWCKRRGPSLPTRLRCLPNPIQAPRQPSPPSRLPLRLHIPQQGTEKAKSCFAPTDCGGGSAASAPSTVST